MVIAIKRLILLTLLLAAPFFCWSSNKLIVEITGVSPEEKKILLSNLTLATMEEKTASPQDVSESEQNDLSATPLGIEEINTVLKSLGYYHAVVTLEPSKNQHVRYHVEKGPPILIQAIKLTLTGAGKEEKELRAFIEQCPFKQNTRLEHNLYESFKQNLLAKAMQLGYLDAIYNTNEIRVDILKNTAVIILKLETGKRYKLGKVHFELPPYPVDYLERYIPFNEGDPYTTNKLNTFQKALGDTDLFSKIRIDPLLNETKNLTVPLNVRLTAKPHNRYTASIGFSTDTDLRASVGWERKRAHFPGHRTNINMKTSKRLNQLNAQYTIPGKRPASDKLAFGTQITEEKFIDDKYSLRNESGITRIQKRGHFEQIIGLHYLSEVFRELPTDPKEQSHFVLPTVGFTWTNIEKGSPLQQGVYATFAVKGALKSIVSSTNLAQGKTQIKWNIAIGEKTRLILRSDLGILTAANAKNVSVPLSLRFFTGGDQTVRGYGYNSLGPKQRDKNGNEIVIGGRYLFVGSTELEKRLYKNIGAAIFVDTGNAMNHWGTRLSTGAGVGLRYETALGSLRLDVARPMLKGKHKPRIHFSFGMNL